MKVMLVFVNGVPDHAATASACVETGYYDNRTVKVKLPASTAVQNLCAMVCSDEGRFLETVFNIRQVAVREPVKIWIPGDYVEGFVYELY